MAKGIKTGGRQKGAQNKITKEIKEMVIQALDEVGGIEYLKQRAIDNPNAFLTLVGKIIPLQVQGDKENPLYVQRIERILIDNAAH